ncbi:MAG: hypothetical protein U0793_17175 [Gemmataceae bacterium]
MTTIKTMIRNRRIDVPAPEDLPDGAEVTLTIGTDKDQGDAPMSPEEIARVLAAMRELEPLEIAEDVAADLDAWERKIDQHGIDHQDKGLDNVFP